MTPDPDPTVSMWRQIMSNWYARQRERIADFRLDKD